MLSHPNILRLQEMAIERIKGEYQSLIIFSHSADIFSLGEGRKKPSMYMVTPYMEHDLSGLLENPNVQFSEPQIKCYMLQLLEGVRYLHQVIHVPVQKVSNILT
jgi:serine/threonine-protein kinase BUR1